MEAALRALEGVVRGLLAVGMAAASLAMLLQIFCRYVLAAPLPWPEEFTVLVFAWLIFLGSAHVQRDDSHLSIDSLRRVAPPLLASALDVLRLGIIAGCGLLLVWQGWALALRTWPLLYPAMGVPRGLLYASVPVCFAIGLVFVAADVAGRIRRARRPEEPRA